MGCGRARPRGHASVRGDNIAHDRSLRWTNGEDDARGYGGVDHASVRDIDSRARHRPFVPTVRRSPRPRWRESPSQRPSSQQVQPVLSRPTTLARQPCSVPHSNRHTLYAQGAYGQDVPSRRPKTSQDVPAPTALEEDRSGGGERPTDLGGPSIAWRVQGLARPGTRRPAAQPPARDRGSGDSALSSGYLRDPSRPGPRRCPPG